MKKLELNVDALEVQSFRTVAVEKPGGTVHAADAGAVRGTRPTRCYGECTVCTYTACNSNERTEIDCFC